MIRSAILVVFLAACTHPVPARASCDVSTDDAVAAVYQRATGKELRKEWRCIRRSSTFPGLVAIGLFANDRGCMWQGVLADCRMDPAGYAARAMAKAGWGKADLGKKKALALAWLAEIDDVRLEPAAPAGFAGRTFTPPTATADGAGLRIEGWQAFSAGMLPQTTFTKLRVVFAADGTHSAPVTLDQVTVPMHP